ncbi:MAG: hypothetical protein M3112_07080 [Actinomycetia bacterium]|nr:hypothetical protein [Actinomycetes bacterium]
MRRHTIIRTKFVLLVAIVVAIIASGCSASTSTEGAVFGIVTEVTGDLSGVESFVVLDEDGNSHKFVPSQKLEVMGQAPTHLRDHVLSGEPVTVLYHENSAGELVADEVTGEMSADT